MKAAGILFRTKDNQVLFLKRGPVGDHMGEWCFPGGKQELNENLEECAKRETLEEVGVLPKGKPIVLCHTVVSESAVDARPVDAAAVEGIGGAPLTPIPSPPEAVDFTTYLQVVDKPFEITLDDESVGYAWAPAGAPPQPLHPGCAVALEMLDADELGVARLMAQERIASPYLYKNIHLFMMRVTGTGVAYRRAKRDAKGKIVREEEFCYRDPMIYLNDDFLARCAGLPVIFYHPEKAAMLTSDEFNERIVGAIMFAFIKGNEVWCIARVYDEDAIAIMLNEKMSTSPAIVLGSPKDNPKVKLEDGTTILFEGEPSLLDHLAICKQGVWDKGGEPTGIVVNDSQENEKDSEMSKEDEDRKDAENTSKLDAIMDAVQTMKDSFEKRCDAMEARCDSFEKKDSDGDKDDKKDAPKADAKKDSKKDSDGDKGDKGNGEEEGEAKKMAADSKKDSKKDADDKDADDEKEKAKADSARHDSDERVIKLQRELEDIRAKLPVHLHDEDYSALIAEQARADDVFQAHGQSAPRPLNGESPTAYRRRVASTLKVHSTHWKGVELSKLGDEGALNIAVDQIYADAVAAANSPVDAPEGMIAHTRRDRNTGHMITTFRGRHSFVRDFTQPSRCVVDLNTRRDVA